MSSHEPDYYFKQYGAPMSPLPLTIDMLQLDPADRAVHRIADQRDAVQKKTFTKWVNKHLLKAGRRIIDLFEGFRDGHNLLSLLEVLSHETLPRERGRMKFHQIQNVQIALEFLRRKGVPNILRVYRLHLTFMKKRKMTKTLEKFLVDVAWAKSGDLSKVDDAQSRGPPVDDVPPQGLPLYATTARGPTPDPLVDDITSRGTPVDDATSTDPPVDHATSQDPPGDDASQLDGTTSPDPHVDDIISKDPQVDDITSQDPPGDDACCPDPPMEDVPPDPPVDETTSPNAQVDGTTSPDPQVDDITSKDPQVDDITSPDSPEDEITHSDPLENDNTSPGPPVDDMPTDLPVDHATSPDPPGDDACCPDPPMEDVPPDPPVDETTSPNAQVDGTTSPDPQVDDITSKDPQVDDITSPDSPEDEITHSDPLENDNTSPGPPVDDMPTDLPVDHATSPDPPGDDACCPDPPMEDVPPDPPVDETTSPNSQVDETTSPDPQVDDITSKDPQVDDITSPDSPEDEITHSDPLENDDTSPGPPVDDMPTDLPVDDITHSDPPLDKVMTQVLPLDVMASTNPPVIDINDVSCLLNSVQNSTEFSDIDNDSDENFVLPSEYSSSESDVIPFGSQLRSSMETISQVDDSNDENDSLKESDMVPDGNLPKNLTERDVVRDSTHPGIYIRRYRKSFEVSAAQASKKRLDRVYDNYHACLVCGKFRQHIKIHAKTHVNCSRVKEIMKMAKPDFTQFRKLGDNKHNTEVLEKKRGEFLLSRRPPGAYLDIYQYGPCPNCNEWILLKFMKDHYRKCSSSKIMPSKRGLRLQSVILAGYIQVTASPVMMEEVFPSMRDDQIGKAAKADKLILALGESWLRRNVDNKEKRRNYASQHMRLAARLLLNLTGQEQLEEDQGGSANTPEMSQFLTVSSFDKVVGATLQCCMQDMDDVEDLRSPSNALKLKHDINRMLDAKWGFAVRSKNKEEAAECKDFMKLMKTEWREKVTKLAFSILNRRQFENPPQLPSPEDVEKLSCYMRKELKETVPNPVTFQRLVLLSLARLVLFNKRRTGEIEVVKLDRYVSRISQLSDLDASIATKLTDVERVLLKSQELLTIRGKNSRPVPVIIPDDCKSPLAYIASAEGRKNAGVPMTNRYLFPNTVGTYVRAYYCLKMICEEVGLKAPEQITSINMRKYTATLTQTMNLKNNEFEWLLNHLGHTGDVHKQHYRQMSGLVERVYISKLLLIQDMNLTNKFTNQDLVEMDVRDIINGEQLTRPVEEQSTQPGGDQPGGDEQEEDYDVQDMEEAAVITRQTSDTSSDSSEEEAVVKKKPKLTRQRWTNAEEDELRLYFQEYFSTKTTPRAKAINKAKCESKKNKGFLHKRANHLIVKKISAINHK